MKKIVEVASRVEMIGEVICNRCGYLIWRAGKEEPEGYVKTDWLSVNKEWGYHSSYDLERHEWELCMTCYDKLLSEFKIPVGNKEYLPFHKEEL